MASCSNRFAAAATPISTPRVIVDRSVSLTLPSDIRWLDDDHVIVTDADRGIARIDISRQLSPISWLEDWPEPRGPGSRYFHLAVSNEYLVAADFAFRMRWKERKALGALQEIFSEYIADVDVIDGRVLISGLRRDAAGQLGTDGSTAWTGLLSEGEQGLKPILPFRNRKAIEDCAGFGLGVVRFLMDGSFIVVPGVEPGIYLYGKDGRLIRVWQTDRLGLDVNCDFSKEQQGVLSTKAVARQQWVNHHPIVDEIIETPAGPALVVRRVVEGGTRWDMLVLNGDPPLVQALPITSSSTWAHLSAARRGRRFALLVADRLAAREDGAKPRLIILEWGDR
jgi:hypothetical protein